MLSKHVAIKERRSGWIHAIKSFSKQVTMMVLQSTIRFTSCHCLWSMVFNESRLCLPRTSMRLAESTRWWRFKGLPPFQGHHDKGIDLLPPISFYNYNGLCWSHCAPLEDSMFLACIVALSLFILLSWSAVPRDYANQVNGTGMCIESQLENNLMTWEERRKETACLLLLFISALPR